MQKMQWGPVHWLLAAGFGLALFGFDALETILYAHARAPNVGLIAQLSLLLVFYMLWAPVVWTIWHITASLMPASDKAIKLKPMVARLGANALLLSVLHMASLAVALRIMYSPPGWGVYDFTISVTELWIRYAGLWAAVYVAFCGLIYMYFHRRSSVETGVKTLVYEVRQGNKIITLDIRDICWVEAADNYVQLHTQNGHYLYRKSLSAIEKDAQQFGLVRTHRSALVNMAFVDAIARDPENSAYHIQIKNGAQVPLSRRRLAAFRNAAQSGLSGNEPLAVNK